MPETADAPDVLTLTETLAAALIVTPAEVIVKTNPKGRLSTTDILTRVRVTTTMEQAVEDAAREAGNELAYRLRMNYDG